MNEQELAEIKQWLEGSGSAGLERAYALRLMGEVERLREALEHSRTLHGRLLAHLRERG